MAQVLNEIPQEILQEIKPLILTPSSKVKTGTKELRLDELNEDGVIEDHTGTLKYTVRITEDCQLVTGPHYTARYNKGLLNGEFVYNKDGKDARLYFVGGELCGKQEITTKQGSFRFYTWKNDTYIIDPITTSQERVKELYINNVRQGTQYTFSTDGHIIKELTFNNGRAEGLARWLFRSGTTRRILHMTYGRTHGSYLTKHHTGEVAEMGMSFMDTREGIWTLYPATPNEDLLQTTPYTKDYAVDWIAEILPSEESDEEVSKPKRI